MMRRRSVRRVAAFSLLEVMVACSLLAGVLFTLGVLIPRGVMHMNNKGFEVVASHMAEQLVDETRGLDQADVPSGTWEGRTLPGPPVVPPQPARRLSSPRQFPPPPYPSREVSFRFNGVETKVNYEFRVEVFEPVGSEKSRPITVSVFWTEPGNNSAPSTPRSWTMTSRLAP